MISAMEAQSPSLLSPEDISDHFAELAATLDNDPFAIYAELATTAAAFPAEHHAAMAGALAMSQSEAVREAALGFATRNKGGRGDYATSRPRGSLPPILEYLRGGNVS